MKVEQSQGPVVSKKQKMRKIWDRSQNFVPGGSRSAADGQSRGAGRRGEPGHVQVTPTVGLIARGNNRTARLSSATRTTTGRRTGAADLATNVLGDLGSWSLLPSFQGRIFPGEGLPGECFEFQQLHVSMSAKVRKKGPVWFALAQVAQKF